MPKSVDWYRRPELIIADLVQRAGRGDLDGQRTYYRAVVLAVDLDGAMLQNKAGSGTVTAVRADGSTASYPAVAGLENPRGAIKARILTDGLDRLLMDADVRVFWPLFPTDQLGLPVAPGEHVYVTFEGRGTDHGLWIARVSGQDSANAFQGVNSYTAPSAQQSAMDLFQPNEPEYQRTDAAAGMAPAQSASRFFNGGD